MAELKAKLAFLLGSSPFPMTIANVSDIMSVKNTGAINVVFLVYTKDETEGSKTTIVPQDALSLFVERNTVENIHIFSLQTVDSVDISTVSSRLSSVNVTDHEARFRGSGITGDVLPFTFAAMSSGAIETPSARNIPPPPRSAISQAFARTAPAPSIAASTPLASPAATPFASAVKSVVKEELKVEPAKATPSAPKKAVGISSFFSAPKPVAAAVKPLPPVKEEQVVSAPVVAKPVISAPKPAFAAPKPAVTAATTTTSTEAKEETKSVPAPASVSKHRRDSVGIEVVSSSESSSDEEDEEDGWGTDRDAKIFKNSKYQQIEFQPSTAAPALDLSFGDDEEDDVDMMDDSEFKITNKKENLKKEEEMIFSESEDEDTADSAANAAAAASSEESESEALNRRSKKSKRRVIDDEDEEAKPKRAKREPAAPTAGQVHRKMLRELDRELKAEQKLADERGGAAPMTDHFEKKAPVEVLITCPPGKRMVQRTVDEINEEGELVARVITEFVDVVVKPERAAVDALKTPVPAPSGALSGATSAGGDSQQEVNGKPKQKSIMSFFTKK